MAEGTEKGGGNLLVIWKENLKGQINLGEELRKRGVEGGSAESGLKNRCSGRVSYGVRSLGKEQLGGKG